MGEIFKPEDIGVADMEYVNIANSTHPYRISVVERKKYIGKYRGAERNFPNGSFTPTFTKV